jgi:hypothetical protein
MNRQPYKTVFSNHLLDAMRERVTRGEQILVLLNRRGYAPVLHCQDCGWKSECPHCSAYRVFHKLDRTLRCHHCGFTHPVPRACPSCGNLDISPLGRGTEQLEEHLAELLADVRRPDGSTLTIARIDADVPFSSYPDVDRIFTLIAGNGLDLEFEGHRSLAVHRRFVPHPYPCDVPTFCHLRDGPCRALNLFTRRGNWRATADILSSGAELAHPGPILLFALQGAADVNGHTLGEGDAAIAADSITADTEGFLYAARLFAQ